MEKQKMKLIKFLSLALTFLTSIYVCNHAYAQVIPGDELPPPATHQMVDSYGMELVSGTAKIPGVSVNIGTSESGMSFSEGGWNSGNHDYQGRIVLENTLDYSFPVIPNNAEPAGHYIIVSTGTTTAKFKKVSAQNAIVGPFTLYKGKGSLTMPTSTTFLYIAADGSEYSFDMAYWGQYDSLNYPQYKRAVAALTEIKKPDGEKIDISYKYIGPLNLGFGVLELHRFDSAVSSLGWMIKYNADRDILPKHDKSVVAINTSIDYCSSSPGMCSNLTQVWPISSIEQEVSRDEDINITHDYQVTYSGTVTNAAGYESTLTYDYYFPTSTYDVVYTTPGGVAKTYTKFLCGPNEFSASSIGTCDYSTSGNAKRYIKLEIGGNQFSYTNWLTTGGGPYGSEYIPRAFSSSGPEGTTTYLETYPENPGSWTDKLGRQQTYKWSAGLINSVININDTTHVDYEYDTRGNILFIRQYPKNDIGDPLVTSATYPTCTNSTTVKNCNKPETITSAAGVITTYTYDSTHGGVLTATAEAINGIQAQTRYRYEQKRAKVKNSAGALVQGLPVWRQVEISSCRTQTLSLCVGTADERRVLIDYDVDGVVAGIETANVLPVRETVMLGDGSIELVTVTEYDIYGNIKSIDGPKPGTYDKTFYFYDALRRKVAEIGVDPDGSGSNPRQATRTYYNGDDQITSIRTGIVTSTTLAAVDAIHVDIKIDTEYDSGTGMPVTERTYANGVQRKVIQKSYDAMLRLDCVAHRLNPAHFNSLPSSACALGPVGPEGNDRITRNEYDDAGALVKIYQAYGTPRQRAYKTNNYREDNGLLESVEDALGNTTFYGYDGYNRLNKTTFPNKLNGTTPSTTDYLETVFDGAVVSSMRLRDGQIVSFSEYDARGRVKTKTGAVKETFVYDNFNYVVGHTNTTPGYQSTTNISVFDFNALGWKKSETVGFDTVSYEYNDYGQRTRLTWPDNFYVTYDYNVSGYPSGQLQNIKEYSSTVLATYLYDEYGRRDLLSRGNGVVTDYEYDDLSRLELLATNINGTGADISEMFGYNIAGQLKTRTVDTSSSSYVYQPSIGLVNYGTPNALNQITSVNGVSTATDYDNRGNMIKESGVNYVYNANNLLTSATGSGNTSTLTYDSENRLSRLVQNGALTDFRYDGEDLIAEKNSSGTITARYVHGAGVGDPIVWYVGSDTGTKRYFTKNYQGSIVSISNNNGDIYAINAYDEYGNPSPANSGRFQYTGQTWLGSQVGLYYYKARVYNPKIGKFMQTDPIGYEDGMNWYAYVGNDPVNAVDPSGMYTQTNDPTVIDDIVVTGVRGQNSCGCISISGQAARNFFSAMANQQRHYMLMAATAWVMNEVGGTDDGIKIDDDGSGVSEITIDTPSGGVVVIGEIKVDGETAHIGNPDSPAHIDGPGAGSLGLSGTRELGRRLGQKLGVRNVKIYGGTRTTGANIGKEPRPVTIKVN